MLNDILTRLAGVKYLTLIDVSSRFHNLKTQWKIIFNDIFLSIWEILDIRLPFGAAPTGDVFQQKLDEVFSDMPNMFDITDDILMQGLMPMAGMTMKD